MTKQKESWDVQITGNVFDFVMNLEKAINPKARMEKREIKKLDIQLLADRHAEYNDYVKDWEQRKLKYVSEYVEYEPGYSTGIFGYRSGRNVSRPDVGLTMWNARNYDQLQPYEEWIKHNNKILSSVGQQQVIDKINEIITALFSKETLEMKELQTKIDAYLRRGGLNMHKQIQPARQRQDLI